MMHGTVEEERTKTGQKQTRELKSEGSSEKLMPIVSVDRFHFSKSWINILSHYCLSYFTYVGTYGSSFVFCGHFLLDRSSKFKSTKMLRSKREQREQEKSS